MAIRKVQRVKPLMLPEWQRQLALSTGSGLTATDGTTVILDAQELATTSDEARLWRGDGTYLSGTVDHGNVASATEMAAIYLQSSCTRGVHPGDTCWRSDLNVEHRCISGHNATAVWRAVGAGATALAATQSDLAAAVAGAQPLDADLTAIAAQGISAWGLTRMADSGATATKSALDIAQSDVSGLTAALAGKQAASDILTTLAAAVPSVPGLAILRLAAPGLDRILCIAADGTVAWAAMPTGEDMFWESDGPDATAMDFTWASNGDANGCLYWLGAQANNGVWTNPHTAGAVTVVMTSGWSTLTNLNFVDRATNYGYYVGTSCFAGVDLGYGRTCRPNKYTLRGYTSADRYLRNWVLEGTNTVSANTAAAWDAASWTTLDTRSADTTMQSTAIYDYACTQPTTGYRYLRWRCTGTDSLGGGYFTLTEFELYGQLTAVPLVLPSWATTFLTDGTHYWPAYAAS